MTPRQPSAVPESFHTPAPESAASALSRSNGEPETLNNLDLDARNMEEEAPAEIEPPSAAQDGGVKPEEAILWLSQHSGADSLGSAITKGEDAHPEEPEVKPRLRLDHIREVSTASATSASDPEDDVPSSLPDSEVSRPRLSKNQRKRMRDKARKLAQMEHRKIVRSPSRDTSNSEDNLVAQEPEPAPAAPVGEPDTATVPETTAYVDDEDPLKGTCWW